MKEKGFSKQERICRRNDFCFLMSNGKSFFSYPFRCVFCTKEADAPWVRIAVSVSKKKFKNAVDRNRIKRLMREAYRLEKIGLYNLIQEKPATLDILVIYTENKILDYKQFRHGMRGMIKKATGTTANK
jgi:ribonuclease P protein component